MGKNQHFVPRWYLRNFSPDVNKGFIHVFDKKTIIQKYEPISKTATKDHFYGEDGIFEKSFDPIETRSSQLIKDIILTKKIRNLNKEQLATLSEFIILQSCRTESAKKISEAFLEVNKHRDVIPRVKSQYGSITKEEIEALFDNEPDYHKCNMVLEMNSIETISDLSLFLINNSTNIPLITSDDPIVVNNYYLLKKFELIGLCAKGLQLICPLTSDLAILLIHQEAYNINSEDDSIIDIKSEKDIHSLNQLQILNCNQQLYYCKENIAYLTKLSESSEIKRNKELLRIKKITNSDSPSTNYSKLLDDYNKIEKINYHFHFSFLKLNHDYNRQFKALCKKQNKKQKFDSHLLLRNQKIYNDSNNRANLYIKSIIDEYTANLKNKK